MFYYMAVEIQEKYEQNRLSHFIKGLSSYLIGIMIQILIELYLIKLFKNMFKVDLNSMEDKGFLKKIFAKFVFKYIKNLIGYPFAFLRKAIILKDI